MASEVWESKGWCPRSQIMTIFQEKSDHGFPGGLVLKNLPCNTGDTSLIPRLGRSHMLLSKWAHALKSLSCNCRAHRPQPPKPTRRGPRTIREATTMSSPYTAMETSTCSRQLEKACTATKTHHSQKYKNPSVNQPFFFFLKSDSCVESAN